MDKIKALIYLNQTGDEALDQAALDVMHRYCERQNYDVVIAFGEETDKTGLSDPVEYMLIGLAAECQIDVVVTMFSEMVSMDVEAVIGFLSIMDDYGIAVETVTNDLEALYTEMFTAKHYEQTHEDAQLNEKDKTAELLVKLLNAFIKSGSSDGKKN